MRYEINAAGVDLQACGTTGTRINRILDRLQRGIDVQQVQCPLAHVVPSVGIVGKIQEQAARLRRFQCCSINRVQIVIGCEAKMTLCGTLRSTTLGRNRFEPDNPRIKNTMERLINADSHETVIRRFGQARQACRRSHG